MSNPLPANTADEDRPEVTSHPAFKRAFQITGLLMIVVFGGAIPLFHWSGNYKSYSQQDRQFIIVTNAGDCTYNGGLIYNAAQNTQNQTYYNCEIAFNATGTSWETGKVSFWYCLQHGGCW